jgi:hypothetical protein
MQRYFVSDQAENEALRQVVDDYKAAKEAKAKHEGRLHALGETLSSFARALQNPEEYKFSVIDQNDITVGRANADQGRPVARLTPADLDWNALCESLRGYINASQEKKSGAARLRDIGLPVSD